MNKKSKRFIILVFVLLLLVGAFFGLQKYNEMQNEVVKETEITIVDIAKDDIIKFSYDYNGETYSFEKQDDTWYYAEDHSLEITQYQISSMLSKLAPLTAKVAIEAVTDMGQYGLSEDVRTIHYETESASYIFEVGDYNSVSGVYYIRKPSDTVVYAVPSSTVTIFDKALEDLVTETEATATVSTEETE